MKRVLLYSGGWDSFCVSKIYPDAKKVYIDLGTPYAQEEIKQLPNDVEIITLNLQRYVLKNGYHIPQRNAILALIAIASIMPEAEKDKDYNIECLMGGVQEDLTAPDKNPEYFFILSQLASEFTSQKGENEIRWNIKIRGFFNYNKITLWEKAGKPDMRNVISCHTGNNCGKCLDCKRRLLYLNYIYSGEYLIDTRKFIQELSDKNWLICDEVLQND